MVKSPHWSDLPIGEVVTFEHDVIFKQITTATTKLIDADPMRVALILTVSGSVTCEASINNNITYGQGLSFGWQTDRLVITDELFPGLASRAWYAASQSSAPYVVMATVRMVD